MVKICSVEGCIGTYKCKGFCHKHYYRIRKHGNTETVLVPNKKYTVNENFFDDWSKESAWFLGWLITDGYVFETDGYLQFRLCDKEICDKLLKIIGSNKSVTCSPHYSKTGFRRQDVYTAKINSRYLCNKIVEKGIRQNKSLTVPMIDVPDRFFSHFLRGCIEGDGCLIINNRDNFYVNLVGCSEKFIFDISKKINIKHTFNIRRRNGCADLYTINFYGDKAIELCEFIYEDSDGLRLERKYQRYLKYLGIRK